MTSTFLDDAKKSAAQVVDAMDRAGVDRGNPLEVQKFFKLLDTALFMRVKAGSPAAAARDPKTQASSIPSAALAWSSQAWMDGKRLDSIRVPMLSAILRPDPFMAAVLAHAEPRLLLDSMGPDSQVFSSQPRATLPADALVAAAYHGELDVFLALAPFWVAGFDGPQADLFARSARSAALIAEVSCASPGQSSKCFPMHQEAAHLSDLGARKLALADVKRLLAERPDPLAPRVASLTERVETLSGQVASLLDALATAQQARDAQDARDNPPHSRRPSRSPGSRS